MTSAESTNYAKRYLPSKAKDHARSAGELRTALGSRPEAASAEKALRELITIKGDVEYGTTLITLAKADPLVRRPSPYRGPASSRSGS